MLFVIRRDIISSLSLGDKDTIRVINDLCTSVRYGRHSLFAERDILLSLSLNDSLNQDSRGVISHIYNYYAMTYGNTINRLSMYVVLSANGSHIDLNWKPGGICEFFLPIQLITDDSIFMKTIFVFENSQESDVYSQMIDYYAHTIKYPNRTCFEKRLGGGNTSYLVFRDCIDLRRICLCFCDSDIINPGSSLGATAEKAINEYDPKWPLCSVMTTAPARELENLLPLRFFQDLAKKNGDIRAALDDYQVITNFSKEAYMYLDIKKGVSVKSFFEQKACQLSYNKRLLLSSGLKQPSFFGEIEALSDDERKNRGGEMIIHCCGSSIINLYIDHFSSPVNYSDLSVIQADLWYYFGKTLFNWSFSSERITV